MRSRSYFALRALAATPSTGSAQARLSILIYHRVLASADLIRTWDPTAVQFDGQMRVISTCFNPLPLDDAIHRMAVGTLPSRAVAVTFDDGYADNVSTALPILQKHRIKATFFIAAGYLDNACMWNDRVVEAIRRYEATQFDGRTLGLDVLPLIDVQHRRMTIEKILAALKHLPSEEREAKVRELEACVGAGSMPNNLMMNESDVRALRRAGMGIGAHTVSHPILTRLDETDARREIVDSRDTLGAIIGERIPFFAYPNGKPEIDYGPEHVRMVKDAGFDAAVSTVRGCASARDDPYQLPRFTPWQRGPFKFALSLLSSRRNAASADA